MCKNNLVAGVLSAIAGLLFFLQALQYGFFSITSDGVPGAGFFPAIVSGILIVSAIVMIIRTIYTHSDKRYFKLDPDQRKNIRPYVLTLAGIIGLLILWHLTNFYLAAIVYSLFINWVYGRTIRFNLIYTAVVMSVIYAAFTWGLNISFRI